MVTNTGIKTKSVSLVTGDDIRTALNWRYAVKRYDPEKKIAQADWATLEDAMMLAPSSMGLQPYKLIVVTDDDVRSRLRAAAHGQSPITDASHIVVFAYKKTFGEADVLRFVDRVAEVRNQDRGSLASLEESVRNTSRRAIDGGYIETWNSRQAYIALGFLIETAALMGIDATPMEGFEAGKFNEILGLDEYSAVAVAALGYRDSANDWLAGLPKVRRPAEELIEHI